MHYCRRTAFFFIASERCEPRICTLCITCNEVNDSVRTLQLSSNVVDALAGMATFRGKPLIPSLHILYIIIVVFNLCMCCFESGH